MSGRAAVEPRRELRIPYWWVHLRRLLPSDTTVRAACIFPSNSIDGGALLTAATTNTYLVSLGDNALGLFGIRTNFPVDSTTLNQEASCRAPANRAPAPVEYYLAPLGTFGARLFNREETWECMWGPTVIPSITDGSGTGEMWYGVGLGGGVTQSGGGGWTSAAFLGWLWDIRGGAGGAARWSCIFRDSVGTTFVNVDSGLTVGQLRDLQVHVGQTNGAPFVRWIADGVTVLEVAGPIAGWAPFYVNNYDWGPSCIGGREDSFNDGFQGYTACLQMVRLDLVQPL